ncbi:MAG: DUF3108 domain-containing protein [Endomicrobium sp.]|jgi:hypothetical protein|nr:DUF3108 domain-containing protein [Endomicrobium sp.]
MTPKTNRHYKKIAVRGKFPLLFCAVFLYAVLSTPDIYGSSRSFVAEKLKEERAKLQSNKNSFSWREHKYRSLPEFEKLTYDVKWQVISVGQATLELRGFNSIYGRRAHHIYSSAKTKPFFDEVFKVRDTNEAWIDEKSMSSLRFVSNISEGGWKKRETLEFDPVEKTYRLYDNGKMQMGITPDYVQDVLTALYYIRTLDLNIGDRYTLEAHSGDMSWPLAVNVVRKEKIKVFAGEFDCLVLEPFVRENAGIMKTSGRMLVWVTDDGRKIPVYLKVKIPIGAAIAELEKIETK